MDMNYGVRFFQPTSTFNRQSMLARLGRAHEQGIPMTNYGLAISHVQGVLRRVLEPFPAALTAFDAVSQA